MPFLARALFLCLSLTTLGVFAQEPAKAHEKPAVFSNLGYDAALAQAKADKRLMILDCMTSWCAPCKAMDKTTWVDKDLVDWIGANAVAIQLDMDHEAALKASLEITAFPTIVVFKDGVEVERVVGSRDAAFMKNWLAGLKDGKSRKDAVRERYLAAKKGEQKPADRAEIFESLVETGLIEEARAEAGAIIHDVLGWDAPTRGKLEYELLFALSELAKVDAASLEIMAKELESIAPEKDPKRLRDWQTYNSWIGRSDHVVRWAVKAADSDEGRKILASPAASDLFGMLTAAGEWRAAGFTVGDVEKRVTGAADWRTKQKSGMMPAMRTMKKKPGRELTFEEILDRQAEDDAADCHAALLAAGRDADAWKAVDTLLKYRPESARARTALVARALLVGKYDATRHAALLTDALEN